MPHHVPLLFPRKVEKAKTQLQSLSTFRIKFDELEEKNVNFSSTLSATVKEKRLLYVEWKSYHAYFMSESPPRSLSGLYNMPNYFTFNSWHSMNFRRLILNLIKVLWTWPYFRLSDFRCYKRLRIRTAHNTTGFHILHFDKSADSYVEGFHIQIC